MSESWYRWDGRDLLITVKAQPKAASDEIVGPHGNALKIRITAPPVDGKANEHLIRFLADWFDVSKAQVELLSGQSGREKRFRIRAPKRIDRQWIREA